MTLKNIVNNSTVRKISGSMFTQGLLSITNLIIGVLIARNASKDEYALYVIAFNLILGAISYQSALVNSPLTVLSPQKNPVDRNKFVSGLGFGQWLFFYPSLL